MKQKENGVTLKEAWEQVDYYLKIIILLLFLCALSLLVLGFIAYWNFELLQFNRDDVMLLGLGAGTAFIVQALGILAHSIDKQLAKLNDTIVKSQTSV